MAAVSNHVSRAALVVALAAATLPLSGCVQIASAGDSVGPPFQMLSDLAIWSFGWFVPALILQVWIASDTEETRTVRSSGYTSSGDSISVSTSIPTGNVIKGDPEGGRFIFRLWVTAYPFGYLYFPVWEYADAITLTGLPNFDWTLLKIVLPVGGLWAARTAVMFVRDSDSMSSRFLMRLWQILAGLGLLNLLAWLVVIFVTWLLQRPSP